MFRKIVAAVLPPIVVGALFLGLWELIVKAFDIKPFLLPAPSAIWAELIDRSDDIIDATLNTGTNALVGLLFGVVFGVAMSFVLMRFQVANELITPLAVALNAIPIIVCRRDNGRVCDSLDTRSGVSVESRGRHVAAARANHRDHRY